MTSEEEEGKAEEQDKEQLASGCWMLAGKKKHLCLQMRRLH
jgi:hypothetical protein